MVSSSCSYAASAMAKSLFVKGADFVAAMVFMFASTNLVIELGIVLVVLMGWQFAVSEFVGGIIMIVLLATARQPVAARAGRRRGPGAPAGGGRRREHVHHAPPEDTALQHEPWSHAAALTRPGGPTAPPTPWPTSPCCGASWSSATRSPASSPSWCRRRCGRPCSCTGHGFWTSVENVIVGPFIAIISFVCSIGNVPLAAALWKGGISFGGVISFIFADLIAFPLLLIYRRYYGTRLMLRMLGVFWALMSTAGLLTEVLFRAAGLVPTTRPTTIAPATSRGTTPPTSTSSSSCCSASSTGSTATGSASAAAAATPATRSAGCRSRRHMRPPRSSTPGSVLLLLRPLRRAVLRQGGEHTHHASDR